MPTRALVVIPARMASVRLPGKPLAMIAGEAMIVHTWRRAIEAHIGEVYVATCDEQVMGVIEALGGNAVLTDDRIPTGTDRVAAAVSIIDPHRAFDCVVNLQGDLPNIQPDHIATCSAMLDWADADMSTLAGDLNEEDVSNSNVVKVSVVRGFAQDFWRSADPSMINPRVYHHVGIYAYRRQALERFASLPQTEREIARRLEQMRALDAGMGVVASWVRQVPISVDTADDLKRIRTEFDDSW